MPGRAGGPGFLGKGTADEKRRRLQRSFSGSLSPRMVDIIRDTAVDNETRGTSLYAVDLSFIDAFSHQLHSRICSSILSLFHCVPEFPIF